MSKERKTSSTAFGARLLQAVPGLQVLRGYERKDFGPDVQAGLVICLVLIPPALAYAELAGSGPIGGIYTALLAGVAILPLTGGDPAKGLVAGAWLALFTGIMLITAAKPRLGVTHFSTDIPD